MNQIKLWVKVDYAHAKVKELTESKSNQISDDIPKVFGLLQTSLTLRICWQITKDCRFRQSVCTGRDREEEALEGCDSRAERGHMWLQRQGTLLNCLQAL